MIDQIAFSALIGLPQDCSPVALVKREEAFYRDYGGSRLVRFAAWLTGLWIKRKDRAAAARSPITSTAGRAAQAARLARPENCVAPSMRNC